MKTTKNVGQTLCLLLTILGIGLLRISMPAFGNMPPDDVSPPSVPDLTSVTNKIAEVTDSLMRDALTELLNNTMLHTPPENGIGDVEEVLRICRSSQRVYCYFKGYEVQHTAKTINRTKGVVKQVYDLTIERISWINAKQIKQPDLVKCYESIKDKYDKLGLADFASAKLAVLTKPARLE